jgi:hypothetical protein
MTDPNAPNPPRRSWRPTFLQARLAVLMMALVCGVVGIAQGEPRLVIAGISFGVIGMVMRVVRAAMDRRRPAS